MQTYYRSATTEWQQKQSQTMSMKVLGPKCKTTVGHWPFSGQFPILANQMWSAIWYHCTEGQSKWSLFIADQIWKSYLVLWGQYNLTGPDHVICPLNVQRWFKFNSKIQILHAHCNFSACRPSSASVCVCVCVCVYYDWYSLQCYFCKLVYGWSYVLGWFLAQVFGLSRANAEQAFLDRRAEEADRWGPLSEEERGTARVEKSHVKWQGPRPHSASSTENRQQCELPKPF